MSTRVTIGLITIIAILLGVFVFINLSGGNVGSFFAPLFAKKATATINNHTFTLWVAKDEKDKEIGLSSKKSISQDQGMIFLFDKPDYYGFWMKNMKFSIDILYLHNQKVVSLFPSVPNPTSPTQDLPIYVPTEPADMVLEVSSGIAKKYNIQLGDSVKIAL